MNSVTVKRVQSMPVSSEKSQLWDELTRDKKSLPAVLFTIKFRGTSPVNPHTTENEFLFCQRQKLTSQTQFPQFHSNGLLILACFEEGLCQHRQPGEADICVKQKFHHANNVISTVCVTGSLKSFPRCYYFLLSHGKRALFCGLITCHRTIFLWYLRRLVIYVIIS